jgi:hypothetical protein
MYIRTCTYDPIAYSHSFTIIITAHIDCTYYSIVVNQPLQFISHYFISGTVCGVNVMRICGFFRLETCGVHVVVRRLRFLDSYVSVCVIEML